MIFQDPMTSLNPLRTIGYHLIEVIRRSHKVSKKHKKSPSELEKVGIPFPAQRMKQYPTSYQGDASGDDRHGFIGATEIADRR